MSRERLAQRAGMSASTVKRAEASDQSVTDEAYSALLSALSSAAMERASVRLAGVEGASVADQIERHALALLELAKKMREGNQLAIDKYGSGPLDLSQFPAGPEPAVIRGGKFVPPSEQKAAPE